MALARHVVASSQRQRSSDRESEFGGAGSGLVLPTVTSTGSSITLSWDSGIASGHSLEIERQEAFTRNRYVLIGSVCGECRVAHGPISWTDTGLPPGATYNYRIADVVAGKTLSRLYIQASTLLVPRPPSSVSTTVLGGDRLGIHVSWIADSSDATGFRVERMPGRSGESSFSEMAVVWADVAEYTDYSVAAAGQYQYRVIAFNSLGDSTPSVTTATSII